MYSLYSMLVEKVARMLKTSPNNSVYIILITGLVIAGISKYIEGHPDGFRFAFELTLATLACGGFLTVLNLLLKDKDWFIKRDAGYINAQKKGK